MAHVGIGGEPGLDRPGEVQFWRCLIGSMLPAGIDVPSASPWKAQIGTSPSAHPAVFQAGRPSPAMGTTAATRSSPCSARYSQAANAPQLTPVRYTR